MYVLGIDGGGTKTKGVIANSKGEIYAEATVGPSNPNNVSKEKLRKELATLFGGLSNQSKEVFLKVTSLFAGMSGVDHPNMKKDMEGLISELLPSAIRVTVNNDAITALYSGTLGDPGVVQIGGTGSITFGLDKKGVLNRVGGWGYLFGDKGSGYALGNQGLEAAFLAYDGLGESTVIHQLILEHFKVPSLPDIIQTVYQDKNPKELIASLSRLVTKAADDGDIVAKRIIRNNALYMAESITCLSKKLFSGNEQPVSVVLTGGLFKRLDLFQETMQEVFDEKQVEVQLVKPEMEPVGGAVVAALKEESVEIDSELPKKFNQR